MTTPLDLAAIRARREAATPGPRLAVFPSDDPADQRAYFAELLSYGTGMVFGVAVPVDEHTDINDETKWVAIAGNGPTSEANARFYAAARTDVGDLLDECERLRKDLANTTQLADERFREIERGRRIIDGVKVLDPELLQHRLDGALSDLARLRAERLAEDAVVEAAIAWSEVYDGGSIFKAVERSRAVMDAVDALRAARAGKDGT